MSEAEVSRDTIGQEELFDSPSQEEMFTLRAQVEQDNLEGVLKTFEGRRVLFNVLARGDIYDLNGEMPFDLAKSQRAIGRREVALELLKEILTVDPGAYILMQQEAEKFEEQFQVKTESGESEDDR